MSPLEATPAPFPYRTTWDLSTLPYHGLEDPRITEAATAIQGRLDMLRARYGDGLPTPGGLANYLNESEGIWQILAELWTSGKLYGSENISLEPQVNQRINMPYDRLSPYRWSTTRHILGNIFASPHSEEYMSDPALEDWRLYLQQYRDDLQHLPGPEAEPVLTQIARVRRDLMSAQDRLVHRHTFTVPNRSSLATIWEGHDDLITPEMTREEKRDVWEARHDVQRTIAPMQAQHLFDTHQYLHTKTKLHNHPHPFAHALADTKVSPDTFGAFRSAAAGHSDLMQKSRVLNAAFMGIPAADYMRWDGLVHPETTRVELIDAFGAAESIWRHIHPHLGDVTQQAIQGGWFFTDATPTRSPREFCRTGTNNLHPFVAVNWKNDVGSLVTLAHEGGHALHGASHRHRPLFRGGIHNNLVTESLAIFSENGVVSEWKGRSGTDDTYVDLHRLNRLLWVAQGQAALQDFEIALYDIHQRVGRQVSVDDISDLYVDTMTRWGEMRGKPEDIRHEWTGVFHFISHPFYLWNYALGTLMAESLGNLHNQAIVAGREHEFGERLMGMMSADQDRTPSDLYKAFFGVDMNGPDFWELGFQAIERRIEMLEKSQSTR